MSDLLPVTSLQPGLSGVAGEYFVAGELSRRGFIASVTLRNAQGIDILATKPNSASIIGIQVKTNQHSLRKWPVSYKIENGARPDLYFVFVNLNGFGRPSYHIVPSKVVADYCRTNHAEWLATPGKGGRPHKDNAIRTFIDPDGKYLDQWEILENGGA
jgi:hypothetical protein